MHRLYAGQPLRRGTSLRLGFAAWTVLGLLDASQSYVSYSYRGSPIPWYQALGLGLSLWYAWAVLSFFIFRVARRFPIEQERWRGRAALHVGLGVLVAGVKLVMDYPIIEAFYCPDPGLMNFFVFYRMALVSHFHIYFLVYWALLGVSHALNYHRKFQERELRASQLETRLAQLQLQCLRMQLHPHFLFNTLNAISALIRQDVEKADHMLVRLGDLLRLTLEEAGSHEVSLRQELEYIRAYLEIEQVRFGARLAVGWDVEPEALDVPVPYLILQPLVENAVRHGIAPHPRAGRLDVRARRRNGSLRLEVEDDGPGLPQGGTALREGIGLSNTRARLRQLYGEDHRFDLGRGAKGGMRVSVDIPCPVLT